MRTSKQLEAEIERLMKLRKKKETEGYKVEERIERLRNTLSKARYSEELKRDSVTVHVTECKLDRSGRFAVFHIKTKEGVSWGTSHRIHLGPHKITRRQYRLFLIAKKRNELARKQGKEWFDVDEAEAERLADEELGRE